MTKSRYNVMAKMGGEWRNAWDTNDEVEAHFVKKNLEYLSTIDELKVVDRAKIPWYKKMLSFCYTMIM
jgi:hypothetical protein